MKIGPNVKLPPDIAARRKDLMKGPIAKPTRLEFPSCLNQALVKIISLPFGQEKNISAEVIAMEARRHIPVAGNRKWLWIEGLFPRAKNDLKNGGEKETEVLFGGHS